MACTDLMLSLSPYIIITQSIVHQVFQHYRVLGCSSFDRWEEEGEYEVEKSGTGLGVRD